MNLEHIMMRNFGKKVAKMLWKYAKEEKKKLEKNGNVFIEIDENCMIYITSDKDRCAFRALKHLKGKDYDDETKECFDIAYKGLIRGLCKYCGEYGNTEKDGLKSLYWKI